MTTNFSNVVRSQASGRIVNLIALFILGSPFWAATQNVGVGTANPLRRLSVVGSLMVDQNSNNYGTLDSAALVFGNTGNSGISSAKIGVNQHDLRFWTGGLPYMTLSSTGNLGVGGGYGALYRLWVREGNSRLEGDAYVDNDFTAQGKAAIGGDMDPLYRLRVYNGNTRFGGDMHATGNVAFGGEVDNDYRLRVIGGNSRFGGDMHATGNVAFGGTPDANFRLRVHSGSSYFGGAAHINGHLSSNSLGVSGTTALNTVTVVESLTILGTGSVRSNGPSPLRIGFDEKAVNILLPANGAVTVVADITDFAGDNDDVRVFVNQIVFGGGNTIFLDNLNVNVFGIDAANNSCSLRIRNLGGANAQLVGTIYLTTIAKN